MISNLLVYLRLDSKHNMNIKVEIIFGLSLISLCLGQQYEKENRYYPQEQQYNKPPQPQIISHKQAQDHDGKFKYAFAAENGLTQGEYIAPDGSRQGAYSYVDPAGKTISVKYTAGKEGFRIIEGDHIPTPPPHSAAQQPQPAYNNYNAQDQNDDGQYRPEKYETPAYISAPVALKKPQIDYSHNQPQPHYQAPLQRAGGNNLNEQDLHYHDEPGKAHSFGTGYNFAFGG